MNTQYRQPIRRPLARQPLVAWLLVVGFLCQPVLAYLATPLVTHDRQGHQVVVCTLQGEKLVEIDLPSIDGSGQADHCPALKLLHMAATAQPAESPEVPVRVLFQVSLLEQTAGHQHHSLHFSAYSTRAPPVA